MKREPRIETDGMVTALGGVDSGREPALIDPSQLAWAINVQCRGGFPGSRPRFTRKAPSFSSTEVETWIKTHRLQGRENYYSRGRELIVISVGGRLFAIDVNNGFSIYEITPTGTTATDADFIAPAIGASVVISVEDASKIWAGYPINVNGSIYTVDSVSGNNVTATNLTDTTGGNVAFPVGVIYLDPNAPELPTVWMEQAEEFLIIQDSKGAAIIFDGAKARRALPAKKEVPTGTAMVYNEEIGRLVVAQLDSQLAIGDIVGGPTSVITFSETGYLAEGGRFRIPLEYGSVTGGKMLANLNRANGQGAMIFSAERGFSTFNLPPNRDTWKALTYPPQVNMPLQFSATSQDGIVPVNGDLYYRGRDGLRTFIYAIKEFNAAGNISISSELVRVLSKDDDALLNFAVGMLFDNRLLFTTGPAPSTNGVYHRAIASLDFNLMSRAGAKAPPAYDGVWTGLNVTTMIAGTYGGHDRAFVFALDPDFYENVIWELHKETGDDDATRVQSVIELRTFTCRQPFELKEAYDLSLWIDRVKGQVDFTVQYRPDSYPCWFDWGTAQFCVKTMECDEEECTPLQVYNAGYKTRIGFGQPPDATESLDNKPARNAYEHQVRIAWTGQCRIRKVIFKARVLEEELNTA